MADKSSPDYKSLYLQAEQRREKAEKQQRQAEDKRRQEKEKREEGERCIRSTILQEYLQYCHNLSRPLRVEILSRSTTGQISSPTDKYCSTRLEYWTDCSKQFSEIYKSVYSYFRPEKRQSPYLFLFLLELENLVRYFVRKPLNSKQKFEIYERFAVEEYIYNIITELYKIPAVRNEFGLGNGIQFSNYINILNKNQTTETNKNQISNIYYLQSDQFCIYCIDRNTNIFFISVEYKLLYKFSVAILCIDFRPIDL